jgi:hypothetical protein
MLMVAGVALRFKIFKNDHMTTFEDKNSSKMPKSLQIFNLNILKAIPASLNTLIPCMNISESNEAILMQKKLSKQSKRHGKRGKP